MSTFLARFRVAIEYVQGVGLLGIVGLILTAIVLRNFFGIGLVWIFEVTGFLMVWMVFIGASSALSTHQHIRIDIVLRLLPPRYELAASIVAVLTCLAVFWVTIHYGLKYARTTWGDLTPMMGVTFGFYTLALPVTSICAALHVIRACVDDGVRTALMSTIEVQAGEGDEA